MDMDGPTLPFKPPRLLWLHGIRKQLGNHDCSSVAGFGNSAKKGILPYIPQKIHAACRLNFVILLVSCREENSLPELVHTPWVLLSVRILSTLISMAGILFLCPLWFFSVSIIGGDNRISAIWSPYCPIAQDFMYSGPRLIRTRSFQRVPSKCAAFSFVNCRNSFVETENMSGLLTELYVWGGSKKANSKCAGAIVFSDMEVTKNVPQSRLKAQKTYLFSHLPNSLDVWMNSLTALFVDWYRFEPFVTRTENIRQDGSQEHESHLSLACKTVFGRFLWVHCHFVTVNLKVFQRNGLYKLRWTCNLCVMSKNCFPGIRI